LATFIECELTFTFAMSSRRLSVCRLSVKVHAPYLGHWNFWQCFYAV